jgi:hypothetical protein
MQAQVGSAEKGLRVDILFSLSHFWMKNNKKFS